MRALRLSRLRLQAKKPNWSQNVKVWTDQGYQLIRETQWDRVLKTTGKFAIWGGVGITTAQTFRYLTDDTVRRNTVAGCYILPVILRYILSGTSNEKSHDYCGKKFLDLAMTQGGVYVKIGQHLSALGHIMPKEITARLKVLQTECTERELSEVMAVLKADLGEDFEEFTEFKAQPEGTASIAQVHRAKLGDKDVAIKIQHRDIAENADADIRMLTHMVNVGCWAFGEKWNFQWLVDEIRDLLKVELDFRNEASNATEARLNHGHFPWLVIPKVYQEYTSKRVLVMDYEAGHAIDDKAWYEENNVDPAKVVSKISYLFNEMTFVTGFLHSDPHAGNLKIRKVGPIGPIQIILLDHGQYRRLSSIFRNDYCNFLHSVVEFGKNPALNQARMLKYAKRLNITDVDMANQLACMMLGVRWSQITDEGGLTIKGRKKDNNWGEAKATQEIIDQYLDQALEIFNEIPSELGIIMKSNDLIRCLETKLTAGASAENYVNMAYLCITGMQKVELSNASSQDEQAKIYWKYFWPQTVIFWQTSYYYFLGLLVQRFQRYYYFFERFKVRLLYGRGQMHRVKKPPIG